MTGQEPLWNVEATAPDTVLEPGRGAIDATRITFTTASGQRSYIVVPNEDFTADKVVQLVHDAAMEIEKLMAMKGPPHQQALAEAGAITDTYGSYPEV